MIIDSLKNASMYYALSPRVEAAFKYLQSTDLAKLEPGRYELDGANLFVLVQTYDSKTRDKGKWESHRKYLDIQYIVEGTELIGYADLAQVKLGSYDDTKDFQALDAEGEFLLMRDGYFMLLAPQDAHMPGMAVSTPQPVKKAVVKIKI
jgi:YhcH/YjgK/YiaL family protein